MENSYSIELSRIISAESAIYKAYKENFKMKKRLNAHHVK